MKQFYTCWVEGTNGGYGYKHNNLESAKREAERLANMPNCQGKKVYVLCCLGWAIYSPITWIQTTGDAANISLNQVKF